MDEHLDDNYADLLVAYLNNELDAGRRADVEEWIVLSEENRKLFESLRKTWDLAGKAVLPADSVDTEAAWDKVNNRITQWELEQSGRRKVKKISNFAPWLRVAAVLIPLLVLTFFTVEYFRKPAMERIASSNRVIDTLLSDGTQIQLNVHSSLEYPARFRKDERRVILQGEAYFQVTHQIRQPFIVATPNVEVKVSGTSFSVKCEPASDTLSVIVDEGRVVLFPVTQSDKSDSLILTAGQQGIYLSNQHRFKKIDKADENELYWHTGTLVFRNAPLTYVISTVSKAYGVKIRLMDVSLSEIPLTSSFSAMPVGKVLEIIAETLGIKVVYRDQTYEVYAGQTTK